MEKQKKLYRSKTNRVFFGICGGLAEYLEIDPVVIRIIFVLLAFMTGIGVLIYIIGIYIIPEENPISVENSKKNDAKPEKSTQSEFHDKVNNMAADIKERVTNNPKKFGAEQVVGLIILLIGLSYLSNYFIPWFHIEKLWPLILVIIGLSMIINPKKKG